MSSVKSTPYKWLRTGDEVFHAMLAAIEAAQGSIRFEIYTYANDGLGRRFLEALLQAQRRQVRVRVLLDAFGSMNLPADFWRPLTAAGGEVRWFNPFFPKRLAFRDHRKLVVCDDETAFLGGFNISVEYEGDGVKTGWCDLGLQIAGPLAVDLAASFDEMFARADFQHQSFTRLRRSSARKNIAMPDGALLLSGPGRGHNPFKRQLRRDLVPGRAVRIIAAYFLPTWRIRHDLMRLARQGTQVQLILPGKSDVFLSQLASRSLYRRLLKAGVEIYEYEPQILHAKLILIGEIVYVGSSNLDPRSLYINYELTLRFENPELAAEARVIFDEKLALSRRIELEAWRKTRNWWHKLRQRWAYFLLVRVDPVIARWRGGAHR